MQPSEGFLQKLVGVDKTLGAWFDNSDGVLNVFSDRVGSKDLVLSLSMVEHESFNDLQERVLIRLREMDVWKQFGGAKEYEKHLVHAEESYRAQKKKEYEDKRKRMFKEDSHLIHDAVENARRGKFKETDSGLIKTKRFH